MNPQQKGALRRRVTKALGTHGRFHEYANPCYSLLFDGIEYRANETHILVELVLADQLKETT